VVSGEHPPPGLPRWFNGFCTTGTLLNGSDDGKLNALAPDNVVYVSSDAVAVDSWLLRIRFFLNVD
jgi:hypothetical protein